MKAITVGVLAKRVGLSRSTLLYYDRIGLLKPSGRSGAGYRLYTERDVERLGVIRTYQQAGLPIRDIKKVLSAPRSELKATLEQRLEGLNDEIDRLRAQQRFILGILKSSRARRKVGVMNVETWTSLLRAAGFSDADMRDWHVAFERQSPEEHRKFLEFLCLPAARIREIRGWGTVAER